MTFVLLEIRAKVTYIEYFRFLQECEDNDFRFLENSR